ADDENKLGITDKNLLNEKEAEGIAKAELFVIDLEMDNEISLSLLLQIHKIAFGELYEWGGKLRTVTVHVGQLTPPEPNQLFQHLYQFFDNLNYKINHAKSVEDNIHCLVYAHYEFIKIHPFVNGNGRTGRILMNLVAMKLGYEFLQLYHRAGESRKIYIEAMKSADRGNFTPLRALISNGLSAF
ncbi:MAG: Fic/DOC family protein, partial [Bacteroidia bacterium]